MHSYFIIGMSRIISRLPFSLNQRLGSFIGWLLIVSRSRMYQTAERNIRYCLPDLSEVEQQGLVRRTCIETGKVATESFWIWHRPLEQVNRLIVSVEGKEIIDRALSKKQGVIFVGAHLGNWELSSIWLGNYFDTAAMYRAPKIAQLDLIIRRGREKSGAKLLTGETKNVRQIINHLKSGNLFLLLSDQEPSQGSGVYAPFFGKPAYTMTLTQRLQQTTDAKVIMFRIIRVKQGFTISIFEPEMPECEITREDYAAKLNQNIQTMILDNPEQFQWSYKRFKTPPDGDYDFYAV